LFLSPHPARQAILRKTRECLRIRMARRSTPVTKTSGELPAVDARTKEHLGIAKGLYADLHQQVEGSTMATRTRQGDTTCTAQLKTHTNNQRCSNCTANKFAHDKNQENSNAMLVCCKSERNPNTDKAGTLMTCNKNKKHIATKNACTGLRIWITTDMAIQKQANYMNTNEPTRALRL